MNQGQKLTDIVGRVGERPLVEQFGLGHHIHATIFHVAGIAAACTVDGNAVVHNLGEGLIVDVYSRSAGNGTQHIAWVVAVAECANGLFLCLKGLVACSGISLDTGFALGPGVTHSRLGALPHYIPFSLVGGHEFSLKTAKLRKVERNGKILF